MGLIVTSFKYTLSKVIDTTSMTDFEDTNFILNRIFSLNTACSFPWRFGLLCWKKKDIFSSWSLASKRLGARPRSQRAYKHIDFLPCPVSKIELHLPWNSDVTMSLAITVPVRHNLVRVTLKLFSWFTAPMWKCMGLFRACDFWNF